MAKMSRIYLFVLSHFQIDLSWWIEPTTVQVRPTNNHNNHNNRMKAKRLMFNVGPVTQRSMPYWPLQNPGADPFGGPIYGPTGSMATTDILCWAAGEGLIERTTAHDDDLVPWDPDNLEDDIDQDGPVYKHIMEIKAKLDAAGLEFHAITCNLHSHPMFRRGGLTNPTPEIRELARQKVWRALRIGALLGATAFIYWIARDGSEVPIVVPPQAMQWIEDGLNDVTDYIEEMGFTNYKMASIEDKPNEPRGHMFLPTAGHAAAFTYKLKRPDFWKVNPELLQHEAMICLDADTCVRFLVHLGKLGFLHFGCQIKGQFDSDFPPLVGPEGLKETVNMFRVLAQLGWSGIVEYDCHPLPTEMFGVDPTDCRKQFIRNCSDGLGIALALAAHLEKYKVGDLGDSGEDLLSIRVMCRLGDDELLGFVSRDVN